MGQPRWLAPIIISAYAYFVFLGLTDSVQIGKKAADGATLRITAESSMNENFTKFATWLAASDALIEQAPREEVAEVARVLALHVAHYRQRYGDVSIEESLEMLRTETVSDEQAKVLAEGFGVLVEVLKALPEDALAMIAGDTQMTLRRVYKR